MGFQSLLPQVPAASHSREHPLAPIAVRRPIERASLRWEGVIVARAWPDGFDEREYQLMLVGGRLARLAHPDAIGAAGQPVWQLTDYERRSRERLLARGSAVYEAHNIACNAGRTVLLNLVAGAGGYSGVNYFAVGTGAGVTPTASDTQLATEYFRKLLTTTTVSGNQVDLSTLFATSEGNTTYTEAALFGNGATGTVNSGSLFAHAGYTYTKSNAVNLTNDYYVFLG